MGNGMQLDMFGADEPKPEMPALTLLEDSSPEYKPRTLRNARDADVTVAFAVDFGTHGEKLTRKAAGPRYVPVAFGIDVAEAASKLMDFVQQRRGRTLNVAGNGIYTLKEHNVSQDFANQWVFEVLRLVARDNSLSYVRSGGQTGIDTAGLVAALALNIPAIGLYPKGFRTRGVDKRDVNNDPKALEAKLYNCVQQLTR
jgi:hypothetical protein